MRPALTDRRGRPRDRELTAAWIASYGGVADGGVEYPGEDMGRVSGRCHTLKQAQAAADAYVSGHLKERT